MCIRFYSLCDVYKFTISNLIDLPKHCVKELPVLCEVRAFMYLVSDSITARV